MGTKEAAAAWNSLLNFVTKGLENNIAVSPLTEADQTILRDNLKMMGQDSNFGSKAILKMLIAHPQTIKIFPQFAKAEIATLGENPEFIALGKTMMKGFEFLVNNIREPAAMRRVLANRPFEDYFVDYVSIPQQLEVSLAAMQCNANPLSPSIPRAWLTHVTFSQCRIPPATSSKPWMRNWALVSLPLPVTPGNEPSTLPTPSWQSPSNKSYLFVTSSCDSAN